MENTKEEGNGRIIAFDCLRVLAAFAVVVLHVAAQNFSISVRTFEWNVYNFFDGAVRWCVPVFVLISGALFLNPTKKVSIKKLYRKYVLHIVVLFAVWSLFYTVRYSLLRGVGIKDCVRIFFTGHYHMWYLQMTIGVYILIPVLKKITETAMLTRYFLLVGLVMTYVIPTLLQFPNIGILRQGVSNMKFYMTLGYPFYFVLGYYLANETFGVRARRLIYLLGLLGFAVTIGLSGWLSWEAGTNRALYSDFSLNVLLESVGVFVFIKYHFTEKKTGRRMKGIFSRMSGYTLGIYLIHPFVLTELGNRAGFKVTSFNPVLSVPALSTVTFLISFLLIYIIRLIPKVGKIIA